MFKKIHTGIITLELREKFKNFYNYKTEQIIDLCDYLDNYPDRLAAYVWIIDNFYVYGDKEDLNNNVKIILDTFQDLLPKIKKCAVGGMHLEYDIEIE